MKKNIFIETVNMETQTVFHNNGSINIYPCDFELGQHLLADGKTRISQRGSMKTDEEGRSVFRPFNTDTGTPYDEIFSTPHGEVREYKNVVVVKHTFKKKLGKDLIAALYNEETDDVKAFIKTRKTDTRWK